jgi:hypothetical protein
MWGAKTQFKKLNMFNKLVSTCNHSRYKSTSGRNLVDSKSGISYQERCDIIDAVY